MTKSGTAEWARLAEMVEERAEARSVTVHTAAENLFLASLYHTISEHFIPPADPAALGIVSPKCSGLSKLARAKYPSSGRAGGGAVRGLRDARLFRCQAMEPAQGPTAIFICGFDTTKELWFLRARRQFAERGISALFIDTPGIGEALRLRKLVTRADYEKPVGSRHRLPAERVPTWTRARSG